MKSYYDILFKWILLILSSISFMIVVFIFVFLFKESLLLFSFQGNEEFSFLKLLFSWDQNGNLDFSWRPDNQNEMRYSIIPLILGSLKVTFIALIFAVPLAFIAAIYTSQFVSLRVRFFIKSILEFISNVPTVVFGFLGLVIISKLLNFFFSFDFQLNGLVAGITLGLAIFPNIYTIYEDFLFTIPESYKEASYALGASINQTIFKVVIPSSLGAFLVAVILGFNRAIGETMIVLMLSGNVPIVSSSLFDPVKTLSAAIASEMGEVIFGSQHYALLFLLSLILFLFTFSFNFIIMVLMRRMKRSMFLQN